MKTTDASDKLAQIILFDQHSIIRNVGVDNAFATEASNAQDNVNRESKTHSSGFVVHGSEIALAVVVRNEDAVEMVTMGIGARDDSSLDNVRTVEVVKGGQGGRNLFGNHLGSTNTFGEHHMSFDFLMDLDLDSAVVVEYIVAVVVVAFSVLNSFRHDFSQLGT